MSDMLLMLLMVKVCAREGKFVILAGTVPGI